MSGVDALVKIGHSVEPKSRVADLIRQERRSVTLVAEAPGGWDHERAVHAKFVLTRVRGEWFTPSAGLTVFAKRLAREGTSLLDSNREEIRAKLGSHTYMWQPQYAPHLKTGSVWDVYQLLLAPMRFGEIRAAAGRGTVAVRQAIEILVSRGRIVLDSERYRRAETK